MIKRRMTIIISKGLIILEYFLIENFPLYQLVYTYIIKVLIVETYGQRQSVDKLTYIQIFFIKKVNFFYDSYTIKAPDNLFNQFLKKHHSLRINKPYSLVPDRGIISFSTFAVSNTFMSVQISVKVLFPFVRRNTIPSINKYIM